MSCCLGEDTPTPACLSLWCVVLTCVQVAEKVITTFARQLFHTGFVHADPHPGNIFIRPLPGCTHKAQVVLLDHGLYVNMADRYGRIRIVMTPLPRTLHMLVVLGEVCVSCGSLLLCMMWTPSGRSVLDME